MMSSLLLVLCTAMLSCESGLAVKVTYNDTVISNPLDYCFASNKTVKKMTDSKAQLTILQDDGDWIVINNGTTDLLLFCTNVTDCEIHNPNIFVYAAQMVVDSVIILLAACTIILHLCLKTLRNDFGVLVVTMCCSVLILHAFTLALNPYKFVYKVNDKGYICAVMQYTRLIFSFIYFTTMITIHFHFALLVYNTHKLRAIKSDINVSLLCKYFSFIILLTMSVMSSIITSDVVLTRTFFATEEGYCAVKVNEDNTTKILTVLALLVFVVQVIMFGIGMILYLMVSRSFCELKRADVKVFLALVSTTGLSGILFVVSLFLINDRSTSIPLLLRSIGTVAEQLLLSITLSKKAIISSSEEIRSWKNSCLHGCVHIKCP